MFFCNLFEVTEVCDRRIRKIKRLLEFHEELTQDYLLATSVDETTALIAPTRSA
jgi:hypothetical protein